jgi:predicted PurR-regulated permease PerM
MSGARQALFWVAGLIVLGIVLRVTAPVLLPFVVGFAVAYLLDPVVDWLERRRLGRGLAATLVLAVFSLLLVLLLVLMAPLIQSQVIGLVGRAPDLVAALQEQFAGLIQAVSDRLTAEDLKQLRAAASGVARDAFAILGQVIGRLWSGGLAFLNILSLVLITPVVAFYLMRDWPAVMAKIDSWLPRDHVATIRGLTREADDMIAGFIRGVGTVCLVLAVFYGAALTLIGLEFGLVIGIFAGFLSFIPFIGAAVGFIAAVGVAFAQFSDPVPILMTAGVFIIGQVAEGNFLTPKLVGERVKLHAVWVIFALLVGGLLFGFVGVLLAVPGAAVIGVLARFAIGRYLESPLYRGMATGDPEARDEAGPPDP